MKNIVLVGFMGTGKTSIAKKLANRLRKEFVEIDELIEKDQKKSIEDIFKNEGEPYFRRLEKSITRKISKRQDIIISTGGGIVLDEENIKNLKKNGILICLETKPQIIWERVKKGSHRPLLQVRDPLQKIKELLEKRKQFYLKADFYLDTSNLSISEAVNKIIEIYSRAK